VYVGVLVALLSIDMATVEQILEEKFKGKPALRESNRRAVKLGYDYAVQNLECPLPIRLQKMDSTKDSILIDGNTATALGCLYAGVTVAAWYPITPATSFMDAFKSLCAKFRKDQASGKNRYCIVQAEDELAAVGVVIGAGWNGARSFTSTAGPGISLMSELIGLAYYAEIPTVIVDVQRTGPSTGMPTRTQQGDILICAYASHGDTKHILLFPANPEECFYFAVESFDLAERFQTPVFMLSDLDIGMNDWVCKKLKWDDSYRPNRGKVLTAAEIEALPTFYRYSPENEDGVAARTLPGVHPKGAFFTRGSGHNKLGGYTEIPDEYQEVMDRLARKHKKAAAAVPAPIIHTEPGAKIGLISLGGCDSAVREAVAELREQGIAADYMRIRAFPFPDSVDKFIDQHEVNYVIEQNRDAQLKTLLITETSVKKEKLKSILAYGGFPLSSGNVTSVVKKQLEA
jgi:2-oxoglutarate ferredoxin oxidoreductase subunit alpha